MKQEHKNSIAAGAAPGEQIRPLTPPDKPAKAEPEPLQLRPPWRPSTARELAPGYLWNSTTQELIPILPEDHPEHRQNREVIIEATRRWNQGASK